MQVSFSSHRILGSTKHLRHPFELRATVAQRLLAVTRVGLTRIGLYPLGRLVRRQCTSRRPDAGDAHRLGAHRRRRSDLLRISCAIMRDFVDVPSTDCYSFERRPIDLCKEAWRWMYTSRERGVEASSFTQRIQASRKPANTKMPKASRFAPEPPVPKLPDNSRVFDALRRRRRATNRSPRSDQGA